MVVMTLLKNLGSATNLAIIVFYLLVKILQEQEILTLGPIKPSVLLVLEAPFLEGKVAKA